MKFKTITSFLLSTILLFWGFYRNLFGLVPNQAFSDFDKGSESLVIGRLVWTRQNTFFSEGGLLGTGDAATAIIAEPEFDHQYQVYKSGGEFDTYMIYKSQSGGQAWVFSILDNLSPFSPATNLKLFRGLTALLSAITISALILWFLGQFGWIPAIVVLLSSLVSHWLTLYGRNLFYSIWDYFLPFVVALFLLDRESRSGSPLHRSFYLVMGSLLFLKGFLSGYDFLIPPMGMVATALVYYSIKDGWIFKQFVARLLGAGAAFALGVLASFSVLAIQIGSVSGKLTDGFIHIINTMGRRTFGTPLDPSQSVYFAEGQKADLLGVIQTIMQKTAIVSGIRFTHLFIIFILAGFLILFLIWIRRGAVNDKSAMHALVFATWLSILSPLAWLIIFKAHAYYHPFTSAIIWHMPTMFMGYALIGASINLLIQGNRKEHSNADDQKAVSQG